MSVEEAIKLLKEEPDYSLSYYKREYAVDIVLKEVERLHSIIKKVRDLVNKEEFTMKQKYEMREELLEILDKVKEG